MKQGLNRKDQILCAKWIKEDIPLKKIAKQLGTTVEVIKRFTPEKQEAAQERTKKRNQEAAAKEKSTKEKAKIVNKVLADDN